MKKLLCLVLAICLSFVFIVPTLAQNEDKISEEESIVNEISSDLNNQEIEKQTIDSVEDLLESSKGTVTVSGDTYKEDKTVSKEIYEKDALKLFVTLKAILQKREAQIKGLSVAIKKVDKLKNSNAKSAAYEKIKKAFDKIKEFEPQIDKIFKKLLESYKANEETIVKNKEFKKYFVELFNKYIEQKKIIRFAENKLSEMDIMDSSEIEKQFKAATEYFKNNDKEKAKSIIDGIIGKNFNKNKETYKKASDILKNQLNDKGIKVFANGKRVGSEYSPYIKNDRTMLPLRAVAEILGAKVSYDEKQKAAIIEKDGKTVTVFIGKNYFTIDGKSVSFDTPSEIKNERTYLPLRAIAEALGAKIDWDGENSTAIVEKTNEGTELENSISEVIKE